MQWLTHSTLEQEVMLWRIVSLVLFLAVVVLWYHVYQQRGKIKELNRQIAIVRDSFAAEAVEGMRRTIRQQAKEIDQLKQVGQAKGPPFTS